MTDAPAQAICRLCTLSDLGDLRADPRLSADGVWLASRAAGHPGMPHSGGRAEPTAYAHADGLAG